MREMQKRKWLSEKKKYITWQLPNQKSHQPVPVLNVNTSQKKRRDSLNTEQQRAAQLNRKIVQGSRGYLAPEHQACEQLKDIQIKHARKFTYAQVTHSRITSPVLLRIKSHR